jgi:hypothetical protein
VLTFIDRPPWPWDDKHDVYLNKLASTGIERILYRKKKSWGETKERVEEKFEIRGLCPGNPRRCLEIDLA